MAAGGSGGGGEANIADQVSEFLRESCPRRRTWRSQLTEYFHESSYETRHPVTGLKCERFPLNTGSAAELFIDPMLSCVDDVDVMYHYSSDLAVAGGDPPPEQLPAGFERSVRVYEIVDSQLPGYVYLEFAYGITQSGAGGQYVVEWVEETNRGSFLGHDLYTHEARSYLSKCAEIHGPARKSQYRVPLVIGQILRIDAVPCVRCLRWPPQSEDWPTRCRIHGWPGPATIEAVVGNGCDVVGVAHPLCRGDQWMVKHQWRLSFSRAEVTLLNSWTLEQQILYHMLRTFVKAERLTKSLNKYGPADRFSNYHIKTVMLWACEITPRNWWTGESNLVSLCVKLLHYMNEWLTKWHGQHYFINDIHFCDYFDTADIDTVSAVTKSITVTSLAQWCVDSYISRCAKLCPQNIPLFCSDVTTRKVLHGTVTAILKWRDHVRLKAALADFKLINLSLCHLGQTRKSAAFFRRFCFSFIMKTVSSVQRDKFLFFYSLLLACFDCVYGTLDEVGEHPWNKRYLDVVSLQAVALMRRSKNEKPVILPSSFNLSSSASAFMRAIAFIEYGVKQQQHISGSLAIELAKSYLLRALQYKDCYSDSVYCLANVYSAVLCYVTGQYQKATDHCTLLTRLQDHSQCSSHVVQGNLLPKIDDNVDQALGLAVLYHYVQETALHAAGPTKHIGVFSTDLFAHYLATKRLLVTKCHMTAASPVDSTSQTLLEQLQMYTHRLLDSKNLSLSDLLLCKLPNSSCRLRRTERKIAFPRTPSEVKTLLTQHSVEYLTNSLMQFRSPMLHGSVAGFVPLFLFRCKLYDRCLQLCQDDVCALVHCDVRLSASYHEFIQLMDDELVSSVGLAVLVVAETAGVQMKFAGPITISQLTLTLYLLTASQCKLCSSATRQTAMATFARVLDLISDAEKIISNDNLFDLLTLKLTQRNAASYITKLLTDDNFCAVSPASRLIDIVFDTMLSAFTTSMMRRS